eukprot:11032459-Ditylum_brightwellii.AAC.1
MMMPSALDLYHSESSCDAFLSIVDAIGYPPAETTPLLVSSAAAKKKKEEESVGEETLLFTLADESFLLSLASCAVNPSNHATTTSETASRAILGLFELATGRSKKGGVAPPPVEDATDETQEDHERAERIASSLLARKPRDNKLRKAGLVIPLPSTTNNAAVVEEGETTCAAAVVPTLIPEVESVRHPGRYVVERPFTSRRLNL